jgi:hypothetical protein
VQVKSNKSSRKKPMKNIGNRCKLLLISAPIFQKECTKKERKKKKEPWIDWQFANRW